MERMDAKVEMDASELGFLSISASLSYFGF